MGLPSGGYQWGGGGGDTGTGGYSAMQPYQWGAGGTSGNINAAGGAAFGQYNDIANAYRNMGNAGVTAGERANLMTASNEPIQANLRASRDIVANRGAQSGNTAGALSAQARLGASAGQQLEAADRANQIAIMQENQRRREAALAGQAGVAQGQAGLYGTSTGYMSSLLGQRARLAALRQQGYTEGAGTSGTVSYSGSFGGAGGG